MASESGYIRLRRENKSKLTQRAVLAADTSTELNNIIAVKTANHQLFIQRIRFMPTTYSAKTLTFQDDANTPVPIALFSIPAAAPTTAGDSYFEADYGPEGISLTAGKNLDVVPSAAGAAGMLVIEAYEKVVSGAINTGVAAASQ